MKQKLTLCLLLLSLIGFAQSPSLINYQGVARDAGGTPIAGSIGLKFELRQGSVSSPTVFSEQQSVTTTTLGVFSTQIGKNSGAELAGINWESGTVYLEVSISLAGGSYTSLGMQQLVSVPYAMHARSVPSTYTNNVLTIGSGAAASVYTLSPAGSSPNTSLTSTGGGATVSTTGTNTFNIAVPATTFSAGTNVSIQGTHPDYTISSTPSLNIVGNNLSISGGNTILIPTSGTIAAVSTSLVSSGAASTATLGANSFSINVPVPTFTNTGQNIITGAYPNFTVNTPTVPAGATTTLVTSGAAVNTTLAPNSYSIHVPGMGVALTSTGTAQSVSSTGINSVSINVPTVSVNQGTGGISVTGAYPSYTISASQASSSSTITGQGAAVVTPSTGNNFTVSVPSPTLSLTGNNLSLNGSNTVTIASPSITGTGAAQVTSLLGNSFTVDVPQMDVALTTTGSAAGVTTMGTNSVSINIPTVLVSGGTNVSVAGSYPNYIVSSAPTLSLSGNTLIISGGSSVALPVSNSTYIAMSTTLQTGGIANLTTFGANDYSIHVAPPVYTQSGPVSITGAYPNYTINSTAATAQTLSIGGGNISISGGNSVALPLAPTVAGSGIANVTGAPNYTVNIAAPVFAQSGPVSITGTYPNFTVNSTAGTTYTNGTGISITSGSIITNTSPNITPTVAVTTTAAATASVSSTGSSFNVNVPPPTFTNSGPATITGTYPSFTITSPASTSYSSGAGISIASGSIINTAPNITPTVAVTTTAAATASVASSGNSFNVNVPPPTFTNSGPATITGTYPSYTITSPASTSYSSGTGISIASGSIINTAPHITPTVAVTTTAAATASVASSGNSFNVNVPPPTFTNSGPATITGTYPSYTITSPASTSYSSGTGISIASGSIINTAPNITPTVAVTTTAAATASVSSSGNSFNVNVPPPTFTNSGPATITGTYPSYTITSPANTTYSSGTGISIASGSIINTSPNITPTVAVTTTAAATASVSSTGSSFNVNVPPPVFTNSGPSAITGTYPNYTLTSVAASSASFVTGGVVSVATVAANSYSISVPQTSVTVSSTVGAVGISSSGTNSFNINVPTPTYNNSTGALTTGTAVISILPSLGVTGNTLSVGAPTNTISLPVSVTPSIYPAGSASVTGSFPSFTIAAPVSPTISGTGLAIVSPATGSNITVNVPLLTYTASTGRLGSGTNTLDITQALSLNGATLTSGAVTNSVDLSGLTPFTTSGSSVFQTVTTNSLGIGTNAPSAKVDIAESASYTGRFLKVQNTNAANASNMTDLASNGLGFALNVSNTNASTSVFAGLFAGGLIAKGKNALNTAYAFKAQEVGGSDLFTVRNDGYVEHRSSSIGYDVSIFNTGTSSSMQFKTSASVGLGFIIGLNSSGTNLLSYEATPMYFGTSGVNRMFISATGNVGISGNVGIGTSSTSPSAKLDVGGTVKIADGTQGANKVLASDASGNASWQNVGVPSGAVMAYAGATIPSGWSLCDGTTLNRTTYANLFAAIGTSWGVGDGSTTFNLPDMRGMFLRGVDGVAGNDPDKGTRTANNAGNAGNNVGSKQTDVIAGHTHDFNIEQDSYTTGAILGLGQQNALTTNALGSNPVTYTTTTNAGSGTETRPKNVYVYYIIKQ